MESLSISPQKQAAPRPTVDSDFFFSLIITKPIDPTSIELTVSNLCEVLDKELPGHYEIIVMDSEAASLEAATQVAEKYPALRVFKYTGDTPVAAGWEQASGNILAVIDGDLTAKPTTLPDLINNLKSESDFAVTSQYKDGKASGTDPDLTFLAIQKHALPKLNESTKGYQLMLEMMGPANIRKMAGEGSSKGSSSRILSHIKSVIGV